MKHLFHQEICILSWNVSVYSLTNHYQTIIKPLTNNYQTTNKLLTNYQQTTNKPSTNN